jgi:hypothetical protein
MAGGNSSFPGRNPQENSDVLFKGENVKLSLCSQWNKNLRVLLGFRRELPLLGFCDAGRFHFSSPAIENHHRKNWFGLFSMHGLHEVCCLLPLSFSLVASKLVAKGKGSSRNSELVSSWSASIRKHKGLLLPQRFFGTILLEQQSKKWSIVSPEIVACESTGASPVWCMCCKNASSMLSCLQVFLLLEFVHFGCLRL